jgi:hypothetical protein
MAGTPARLVRTGERPRPNAGIFELYRQHAEEFRRGQAGGSSGPSLRPSLALRLPAGGTLPTRTVTQHILITAANDSGNIPDFDMN